MITDDDDIGIDNNVDEYDDEHCYSSPLTCHPLSAVR